MNKLKVLIASRCKSAAEKARELLERHPRCDVEVRFMSNGSCDPLRDARQAPDLLLLYDHQAQAELEFLQARPAETRPALVVFGPGDDPKMMRLALRAGARDYFSLPLDESEMLAVVDEILESGNARAAGADGKVHVFINGKGGSGASFLAANVAHDLVGQGNRVTLVDLDLQFAGLCRYLDLVPKQGIHDALQAIGDLDQLAAEAFTTAHASGLRLLAAKGDQLLMNQDVAPGQLVALLELYRCYNDVVVVDLPRSIDALGAAVLEIADRITLVMQQSYPHLHDTVRLLSILRSDLRVEVSRIEVAVNRYAKNLPILLTDIENALQVDRIVRIPNHFRMASESVNSGIPVAQLDRKSAVAKGLRELGAGIGMPPKSTEGGRGNALPALFRR